LQVNRFELNQAIKKDGSSSGSTRWRLMDMFRRGGDRARDDPSGWRGLDDQEFDEIA
jgi:hypothetical protein